MSKTATRLTGSGTFCLSSFGCDSKFNRRGKPQVLVHVSTYQGNPFWYSGFVNSPQPFLFQWSQPLGALGPCGIQKSENEAPLVLTEGAAQNPMGPASVSKLGPDSGHS